MPHIPLPLYLKYENYSSALMSLIFRLCVRMGHLWTDVNSEDPGYFSLFSRSSGVLTGHRFSTFSAFMSFDQYCWTRWPVDSFLTLVK